MLKLCSVANNLSEHPENFVDTKSAATNSLLLADATKSLYSLAKKSEPKKTGALDQLLLEGFDQEQIWEQLQLLNKPILQFVDKQIKTLAKQPIDNKRAASESRKSSKKLKIDEDIDDEEFGDLEDLGDFDGEDLEGLGDLGDSDLEDGDEGEGEGDSDLEGALEGDSDLEDGDEGDSDLEGEDDEDMGDESMDDDGEGDENGKSRFSLDEMDDYAEDDMEDDEELGDLLNRAYNEDEDEEDEEMDGKSKPKGKHVLESSDEEESEEEDEKEDPKKPKPRSRFDIEMGQMKEKIKALEDAAVAPKSWTMVGEVSYKERPTNSLLAEDLFFDYSSKPPPIITQERTASLEDIIKQRISKGQWDDVIRKTDKVREFTPTVELDSTKNTEGLAAVYENQYLQSVHGVQGPESNMKKIQKEAQDLFNEICGKLDQLSHFHYTPKKPVAEAHVKTNAPALAAEEATPAAVSTTTLIAPQEILYAPRTLKDKAEMSQQENKAHRRHRKEAAKKQKDHAPKPTGPVSQADALAELKKDRRVTIVDSSATRQKTSSAKFFKSIQDQPTNPTNKSKRSVSENSKSFKL